MDIAIIGAGASGLMCAIAIKNKNKNNTVTIYERNNKCGKKILITGNGRCNYFNEDFNIKHYNSSNIDILKNIINEDNKNKLLEVFDSLGIIPKIQNGYYYPVSNQASTIVNALTIQAKLMGINFVLDTKIEDIKYDNKYILLTQDKKYYADKVVLALGSKSAPNTGSDGLGYKLASSLGHSIIHPLPSLVQLISDSKYLKDWAGVRSEVRVSLIEDNIKIKEEYGEIQLTDYGVSGICIFNLSGICNRGLYNNKSEKITIDFMPNVDNIEKYIIDRNNKLKNRTITELLDGLLNYKLVNLILKKNNINPKLNYNELTIKDKNNIFSDLKQYTINIIGYNDFDKSQVTSGGIPLNEININTFESIYSKGLYIIGELLDVDGECGGYNLSFAFLSGILAGISIGDNI